MVKIKKIKIQVKVSGGRVVTKVTKGGTTTTTYRHIKTK